MAEYIKREDVQNMLDNAQIITDAEGEYFGYCTEDVDINSIPAAEVRENVRGRWKYESCAVSLAPVAMTAKCSKCGIKRNRLMGDVLNYCPYCGADMRGDDNGKD